MADQVYGVTKNMDNVVAAGGTTGINGIPASTWVVDCTNSGANAGGRRLIIDIIGTSAGRGAIALSTDGSVPTTPTGTTATDGSGYKFCVGAESEHFEFVAGREPITDFSMLSGGFTASSATWTLLSS